jgi:mannosyltransferase OCH1-like enzyme
MDKYKGMLGLTEERMDRFIMDEKVDLLRLFYLHDKGGIYSDMDNKINYTCLEKFIEKKNLTQFFSQEQYDETYPSNNFIYSPTPRHPNIEFVLNKVKEFENFTDFNFVGTAMFRHIMENLTYVNIR